MDGTNGMPKHVGEDFVICCVYISMKFPFSSVIYHFSAYCIALNNICIQKYRFFSQKDKNGGGWELTKGQLGASALSMEIINGPSNTH